MTTNSRLGISFEWHDPGRARGEELRATWASLSISVDSLAVTELQDRKTRSVRNEVFLPLFPLAEWIADNWWFLESEVERLDSRSNVDFDRRHNIRWAREGYALPSLRFVSRGEDVEVQWQPYEVADAAIRFLSSGSDILPMNVFLEQLQMFVEAVIARLEESGITDTALHEQWSAIESADADEREFCRAAARLGEDPYALGDEQQAIILDVAGTVRAELLDDLLSLATVNELDEHAGTLRSASQRIDEDDDDVDALATVRNRASALGKHPDPWQTGYRFAEELRRSFNGADWKSRSLEDLAGHLGIDHLDHCLLQDMRVPAYFDALTGRNQRDNPKFVVTKTRPDSRQFAFCRALFEHLTLPRERFAVVCRLRTYRQQMNRAFAAEFLAPHGILRGAVSGSVIGEEEVGELATDFGVSEYVIRHQLENHQIARVLA